MGCRKPPHGSGGYCQSCRMGKRGSLSGADAYSLVTRARRGYFQMIVSTRPDAVPGSCLCQGHCLGHGEASDNRPKNETEVPNLSRRLLRSGMAAGASGLLLGAGVEMAAPRPAQAQSTLTPDTALQALMDGNQRFISRKMTSDKEDLAILQVPNRSRRAPFANGSGAVSAMSLFASVRVRQSPPPAPPDRHARSRDRSHCRTPESRPAHPAGTRPGRGWLGETCRRRNPAPGSDRQ
jgi:hypothetical protein